MPAEAPVRRSVLFVPAKEKMLRKAQAGFGADVVILDLEDAVSESDKDSARATLKAVLAEGISVWGGAEVVVRVNGLDTP
jgi:citrate lyase beta subunit